MQQTLPMIHPEKSELVGLADVVGVLERAIVRGGTGRGGTHTHRKVLLVTSSTVTQASVLYRRRYLPVGSVHHTCKVNTVSSTFTRPTGRVNNNWQ